MKENKKDKDRLKRIWRAMKDRCLNKKNNRYHIYGLKGIKVCDEWLNSFENFYNWSINNNYHKGLSIDRIDVNGNYEPSNCRWVTMKIQQNNRSNTIFITYKGKTKSAMEWHEITGIKHKTILTRYHRGLPPEEILEKTLDYNEKILEFNGKKQSISAWGRELGIEEATLQNRIRSGWTVEKSLTEKVRKRGIIIEYEGEKLKLSQWAKKLNIPFSTLYNRYKKGWLDEEILFGKK